MPIFSGFPTVTAVLEGGKNKIIRLLYNEEHLTRANAKRYQLAQLQKIKTICKEQGIEICPLSPCESEDFVGGIAVECCERDFSFIPVVDNCSLICYLDGVCDPYNAGQTIRTLYLMGFSAVIFPNLGPLISCEILARASAGASERISMHIMSAKDTALFFTNLGYDIICAEKSKNAKPLSQMKFSDKILLVIGGEKRGISRPLLDCAKNLFYIEYAKECSTALGTIGAAAIMGYEISRRRANIK